GLGMTSSATLRLPHEDSPRRPRTGAATPARHFWCDGPPASSVRPDPSSGRPMPGCPARRRMFAIYRGALDARLPVGLSPPVEVALARAVERMPRPGALPGGAWYEPK